MFFHNFKYSLKTLFKNRMLIFWTFAFPIILGTLFNMAFKDIESSEQLDIIDIAIVENEQFNNNEMYKEIFNNLSDKNNEDRLFNINYTTKEEASKLLEDEKVSGYLIYEDGFKIFVKTSGINETILKTVTEEIKQNEIMMNSLTEIEIKNGNYNYEAISNDIMATIENSEANIEDISSSNLSYTMIEFYTLIAMTCLYGGILGMVALNGCLANMTNNGKRVSVAPIKKSKLIISSLLASYIVQVIGIALLFLYTTFVLKVDYGNNLPLIILLALVGTLAGLALGIFVSAMFKANENTKTGIIISVTMLGCFLSGMMGITMKYIVDKNVPIINKLNPASMITDGFYSLYYYDTETRYFFDIISLIIFAFILIGISIFSLRRQKYDSI